MKWERLRDLQIQTIKAWFESKNDLIIMANTAAGKTEAAFLPLLSEIADLLYKCDELYCPSEEIVLRWNDPALDIHWGCDAPKLSARDADGRTLAELEAWLPRYLPA